MITVSANEAKQSFGQMLDTAQREPVVIQKHNRPAAVLLSTAEYERLRGLNLREFDVFCDMIGTRAKGLGLTESKLEKILAED